ncbi:hypothetical protein [Trichocoleus sp. FACHB-262]|uniref:hypothetical protein n=1 Tax=Trichocoleus sp. FACHB-262 TaxID=2692869 RepID=UPI0016883569|nr:hypothetical protein [Trichocoleus sp. FACHB-262]MBD2122590.1 hypothetical protein [Trichocoleus sp. FACHB-262]
MSEKLLLAVTITFSLNLFLGGNWSPGSQALETAQTPVGSSQLANNSEAQAFFTNLIKPPAL